VSFVNDLVSFVNDLVSFVNEFERFGERIVMGSELEKDE
jgi:hypothetical protein